jgi:site-specific DNA recombinase
MRSNLLERERMMIMKIAIYARVSSDTQTKEGTIDSQVEALRDYAKSEKLKIISECIDDGYSGTTLDRPGLDQLRDLAQSGSIEGVLILAPDRLSRKQANQIILMEEFKRREVKVIFTNQSFDDTPEGNFMLQVQGALSELERAKILDRMRRGIIHSVKKGQVIGNNPPYGYRYIPKSKDAVGHWEINSEEAKVIQYIFDLYVNKNVAGTTITKILNDEAIPCRSAKWWSGQIYLILKSETYTGTAYMFRYRRIESSIHAKASAYRKHKNDRKSARPREDWIGIPVPAIIDQVIWSKAQNLLTQNARLSKRNNNKNNYLLRGLVVCGLCGSMASGYVSHKSTYYSCRAKRGNNITSIPHDEVVQVKHKSFDDKVWAGLSELLGNPENLKEQLEKRLMAKRENSPSSQSTIEFDKDLNKLALQENRILDAYREDIITLEELKAQKEKILSRRKVLGAKKKAALSHAETPGKPQITMDMLGDVSARFQRVMRKADFATRDKLSHLLINSVMLTPDKAVIVGNIPLIKIDVLNLTAASR